MKKVIKAICCILAAVILVGGGYVAGQRAKQSSIVSALPKNILDMPKESNEPSESAEPEGKPSEDVPEPKEDVRIINKSNESAVDSTWSTVESSSNTTDNGALTLYTSAQKDGDEFIWDDSQKWVLEVSDGNGGYYTLFDQNVSNGSVYYDVAETDNGTKNINVYVFTGAGTTDILILYFFISLMEDSGYMARAAFIMDKIMHKMGLHGKSFIPLIMGFGCNVPAIMASRTIENRKSRLVTMLINPLMSCSARLPIYLLLVGAFFPNNASFVLLVIYAIGILLAVVMARLFCRFLVKGDDTPFVMELPPYRMPTSKAIFRHTWEKGAQYLRKMGGIIMVASIVIWALGYYPNHDEYESVTEQQENSYIGRIGKAMEPVIEPLGFDWKLGIGILSGVGAKELVVSTLGVLYADDAEADAASLGERIPITPLVAFGYMVFVLIYFPCIATLAAIKGESGSWKWAVFAGLYTTALAWLMSFAIYQIGGLFL